MHRSYLVCNPPTFLNYSIVEIYPSNNNYYKEYYIYICLNFLLKHCNIFRTSNTAYYFYMRHTSFIAYLCFTHSIPGIPSRKLELNPTSSPGIQTYSVTSVFLWWWTRLVLYIWTKQSPGAFKLIIMIWRHSNHQFLNKGLCNSNRNLTENKEVSIKEMCKARNIHSRMRWLYGCHRTNVD